jgi:hypothetical protein
MTLAGFEPAIPAGERPQTHALERAVSGIILCVIFTNIIRVIKTIKETMNGASCMHGSEEKCIQNCLCKNIFLFSASESSKLWFPFLVLYREIN